MCTLQNTHGTATKERHSQGGLGQNLKGERSSCRNQRELTLLPHALLHTWAALHAKATVQQQRTLSKLFPGLGSSKSHSLTLCCVKVYFLLLISNSGYLVIALGSLLQEQRRAAGEAVIFYSRFPHLCCFFVAIVASHVSPVIIYSSSWRIVYYLTSPGYSTMLMNQGIKQKKK